jgi:hypothetical protein
MRNHHQHNVFIINERESAASKLEAQKFVVRSEVLKYCAALNTFILWSGSTKFSPPIPAFLHR